MKSWIKKVSVICLTLSILLLPTVALANNDSNPLKHVQIGNNGETVDKDQVYDDLNSILELIYFGAGILTVIATIFAAVLLSTAMGNPQRRNTGLVALMMALVGGWVLYKAFGLQQWVQQFGSN